MFSSSTSSTATIDSQVSVAAVTLAFGTATTLLVNSGLSLSGVLDIASGTLDLARGGIVHGGTLEAGFYGVVTATGGVLDGVTVVGKLGGGVTINPATATLSAAANAGTLAVTDTLHLLPGLYDTLTLANVVAATPVNFVVDAGTVTVGSGALLNFSLRDPHGQYGDPPKQAPITIGGAGTLVNNGLIYSEVSDSTDPFRIAVTSFVNAGTLQLAPAVVPGQQLPYTIKTGPHATRSDVLYWTVTLASQFVAAGNAFTNSGTIEGSSALVDIKAASFVNSGQIALADGTTQVPVVTQSAAYISSLAVPSSLKIESAGFSNTGTIAASTIEIDGNVTLLQLGTLQGHVVLAGTLDLQGRTLDLGAIAGTTYSFKGGISNGTIVTGGIPLDDAGARLTNVAVVGGVLKDVVTGSATLDANYTNLLYSTAASVKGLAVTAGAFGVVDHVTAGAAGKLNFDAATTISDVVANATLEIDGPGTFVDNGRITVDAATLVIATTLDGNGTISLANGASLSVAGLAATDATTVAFGAGRNNLLTIQGTTASLTSIGLVVTGLQPGDVLDFTNLSANSGSTNAIAGAAANNGTLDVSAASGQQASLGIGNAAGLSFVTSSDADSGTLVTVACFRVGTAIAVRGGEAAVETLRIGDMVLTASGRQRPVRWIGRRAYAAETVAAQPQLRPVRIAAGALGHGLPRRDLYLSPLHALLLDGVLVPAAALVNGVGITRAAPAAVSYVHVELDSGDVILAEGAASETFVDCDSREMFHNAHDYRQLYPGAAPPKWHFAAPRVEQGWRLRSIQARLAGRRLAASRGRLRGRVDHQANGVIEGWAMDADDPTLPVEFELVARGRQLGCVIANRYRIDLDRAQIGHASHAFVVELPELDAPTLAGVALRRLSDGATLAR